MASSAPYWGNLDPPAALAKRQNSIRKPKPQNGHRDSLQEKELPPIPPTQTKPNRISIQSQAPTVSTTSPFASPVASTFRAEGLKPRPPSYPYGAPEAYNKESLDRRRKRASREKEQEQYDEGDWAAPPHAPDIPRQPPLSYKQPYSNGESSRSSQPTSRSRSSRLPVAATGYDRESPEDYYRADQPIAQDGQNKNRRRTLNINTDLRKPQYAIAAVGNPKQEDRDPGVIRRGTVDARKDRPEIRGQGTESRSRKGSAAESEGGRRREWAPDRSPLQRLELTLDSITKEEKRARVEEAESIAREEKARGENSVHFQNRPTAFGKIEPEAVGTEKPQSKPRTANTLAKGFEYQPQRQVSKAFKVLSGDVEVPQRQASTVSKIGTKDAQNSAPQRGLSFRERATGPLAAAVAGVVAGNSLSRSTSNKLKKDPPGDPWLRMREGAERAFRDAAVSKKPAAEDQPQREFGGPLSSSPTDAHIKTLDAAKAVEKPKGKSTHPSDVLDLDSDDSTSAMPVRRNSARKVEQLMGTKVATYSEKPGRSEALAPVKNAQPGKSEAEPTAWAANGVQHAAPASTGSRDVTEERAVVAADGHHYFSKIVHAGRNRRHPYRPGAGIYAPAKRLDEWKKGEIASLTGAFLDVDIRVKQTEAEKDKAWWEAGHTGKRRPSFTKPLPIEAYDGENENSNGNVLPDSQTPQVEAEYFSLRSLSIDSPIPEDENEGCSFPLIVSNTWVRDHDQVVPRARQYIGFQGTSKNKARVERRDKSWYIKPESSKSKRRTWSSIISSAISISRSSTKTPISPKGSYQNLSHSYSTNQKRSKTLNKGLTRSVRSIRVRASIVPTQFKPALHLHCGPLLRYCGMRTEKIAARPATSNAISVKEIWRGSVMIVTKDSESSYETPPTLRLFSAPKLLLPPPPAQFDGETDIPPEYVDPVAGLPKIARDGRTVYVRPVEDLPEEKDLSKDESDEGLFEKCKTGNPQGPSGFDGPTLDGEKVGKSVEIQGIRLAAERGVTFWRFNIEVELRDKQQRIAYRINRGPATGFWVPARGASMNIMFYSCNGFSLSVNPDQFSGPDPMWRDVLNTHQTQPFHVMVGGGDQIYNDVIMRQTTTFKEWLAIKNPLHKHNAPFTPEMQEELEDFYLNRYAMWFSQGLFGLANSQIPMVNIYDDHDIIDGFGSYPHHFMASPVFTGLGAIAFKYYMLFQHQSSIDEGEDTEPSWILGNHPGPYIQELSRSVFMNFGTSVAFLGLDCRTERTREDVMSNESYDKVLDRCRAELVKGQTKHLIVLLGVPIAYPRLVWLENILTSRLMDPVKAMGRAGVFGNFLNQFDGGVEILDDLDDHWTAKNHKDERNYLIEDLQALAAEKSVRITILGGDVHLAAIGQFFSSSKLGIPKDRDHRYMPNVISSAIVNTPPPDMMADILNKRNKIHHLDDFTDEDMIPLFTHDVNGVKRNNKCLLPRRNWCSIREYNPELSPPPTPVDERSPSPPRMGLLRRLSNRRGPSYRGDASPEVSRPPISGPPVSRGGIFRRLSLSRDRPSTDSQRPSITRTLSLSRKDFIPANLFRRSSSRRRPDDGGINGYGAESEDEYYTPSEQPRLRGGAVADDDYFSSDRGSRPARHRVTRNDVAADDASFSFDESPTTPSRRRPPQAHRNNQIRERVSTAEAPLSRKPTVLRRPFHRVPTGLSEKAPRDGRNHEINLEGGLDICLNVEVSQKDPAGITTPYRLLVPALWYDEALDARPRSRKESVVKKLMSFGRGRGGGMGGDRSTSGSRSGTGSEDDDAVERIARRGTN